MKKHTKTVLALFMALLFSFAAMPMTASAINAPSGRDNFTVPAGVIPVGAFDYVVGDGYVEVKIPIEALQEAIAPRIPSPMSGYVGTLQAFFPRGSRSAWSNYVRLNGMIDSIPITARVTNVNASFQVATDPWSGIFRHSIHIALHNHETNSGTSVMTSSTGFQSLNTNFFNGFDPWGIWQLELAAVRDILGVDNGATATVRSLIIRIDFR